MAVDTKALDKRINEILASDQGLSWAEKRAFAEEMIKQQNTVMYRLAVQISLDKAAGADVLPLYKQLESQDKILKAMERDLARVEAELAARGIEPTPTPTE
jgi:hypothetical protein